MEWRRTESGKRGEEKHRSASKRIQKNRNTGRTGMTADENQAAELQTASSLRAMSDLACFAGVQKTD
jgi:hypothetical protein